MTSSPVTALGQRQRRTIRLSHGGRPATGELSLHVARHGEVSVAERQFHQGGLSVMRPLRLDGSGQVCYAVVNPGGGYLDQDVYAIDIEVAPRASLLLTSQSATKVYRTPTAPARQTSTVRLRAGAVLESLPDQLIVYKGGSYRQDCVVLMDPDATYIAGEVVTAGWSPDGAAFTYGGIQLRTEVWIADVDHFSRASEAHAAIGADGAWERHCRMGEAADAKINGGKLVLVDNCMLRPEGDSRSMSGIGLLDGHTHIGSFIAVDRRVDADVADAAYEVCLGHAPMVRAGVTIAPGPSLIVRALADTTADAENLILDLDALLRRQWLGQNRVNLRKY